jgi:hypothetical protein
MTDVKLSVLLDIRGLQNTVLPGRYPPQVQCNTLKQLEQLKKSKSTVALLLMGPPDSKAVALL